MDWSIFDTVIFAVFPYVATVIAIVMGIYRYYSDRFSFSSLSSQFLENRTLFWGSVPWHYGIVLILTAHLLAWLFPTWWGLLLLDQVRLYVFEVSGLALALMTVVGMSLLIFRRINNPRALAVTSPLDWFLLVLLLTQVAVGFWIALVYRWGSDWYLHTSVPWLNSLLVFNPQIQYVTALPWLVKFHLVSGFIVILLFPFSRLVHVLTYPITYLWRPLQVVIWNRKPSTPAQ